MLRGLEESVTAVAGTGKLSCPNGYNQALENFGLSTI